MTIQLRVFLELDGYKTGFDHEVTEDVHLASGVEASRGMSDGSHFARTAATGLCTLALLNSTANAAGIQGYYSKGHANQLSGFDTGIGIQLQLWIDDDGWVDEAWSPRWTDEVATVEEIWTGSISKIEPDPGQYFAYLSHIQATDYMDRLARHQLTPPTVGEGTSESDAFENVLDQLDIQPRAKSITAGPDSYDWVHDLVRDESTKALTEVQRIALSSYGTVWPTGAGTVVYEPRNAARAKFGNALTPDLEIVESDLRVSDPIVIDDESLEVRKRTVVTMTPRSVDRSAGASVLWTDTAVRGFDAGGSFVVRGLFVDPDTKGERTGAVDVVNPAATTDYLFNTEADGSGTNETANVTVTAAATTNAAVLTIDTTGVSERVYATLLQVRGWPLLAQEALSVEDSDATSIAAIGQNDWSYDMPYQSTIEVATAMAEWFLDTQLDDERKIRAVPLRLSASDSARAIEIAQAEISEVFSVVETVTGLDGTERFFINGKDYSGRPDGSHWFTLRPAPADSGPFVEFAAGSRVNHIQTGGENNQSKTVFTTGKGTGTTNWLQLLWLNYGRDDSVSPTAPTSVTGAGLTFDQVDISAVIGAGGVNSNQFALYRAMGTLTANSAITITFPNNRARCTWSWVEFGDVTTGSNGANAVVQSDDQLSAHGASSITSTLAAFSSFANRPAMGAGTIAAQTITQESGWSLASQNPGTSPIMTAWHETDADETCTATLSGQAGAVSVELERTNTVFQNLETDGDGTPATSFASGSVDPEDNALVLVTVASQISSGSVTPNKPTLTGNGVTYQEINDVIYDEAGSNRSRMTTFRGQVATPSAGAITMDFAGQTQTRCAWTIDQAANADDSGTHGSAAIVQSKTDSDEDVDSIQAALDDFTDDDNKPYVVVALTASDTVTENTDWTQLGQRVSIISMLSAWRDAEDLDASATIAGGSGVVGIIALEIKNG